MNFSLWIARRYFFSRSAGRFAPLLSAVAVASVALGTMALIVVLSVMRGFREELSSRLLGFDAHITLTRDAGAETLSKNDVDALFKNFKTMDVSEFVEGEVAAQSASGGDLLAQGAKVKGIDPSEIGHMHGVEFYFPEGITGQAVLSENDEASKLPRAIIGSEIASQLLLSPDFGDVIELVAPLAEIGPTGDFIPNLKRFTVAGVFHTGIFGIDGKLVLVDTKDAEKLLGEQARDGWQIRLDDPSRAPAAAADLKKNIKEGWSVEGWQDHNKKLFAALKLERIAMSCVLLMAVAIASFTIAGVVMLVAAAKQKDIAILSSLGLDISRIKSIFIMKGALIGALGSLIGTFGGVAICIYLVKWPVMLPQSYYLDYLPVNLNLFATFLFAIAGVVIAAAASYYPVREGARLNVIEVLRYE